MNGQFIITISREFGSGGHEIAENLSKRLGVKLYDRAMLDEISAKLNVDPEVLRPYEEKPRNFLFTRRIGKHSNSMEEILAEMQFNFIKEKADSGESFVVVGRCADSVLSGRKGLVRIFVTGCTEHKVERVMKKYNLDEKQALDKMKRHDMNRKWYHNRYSDFKWGDSRHYDICINSFPGIDDTTEVLEAYIKKLIASLPDGKQ
ncbi:MAG TPA: cytidylate kinase-like family protein [Candidatus Alectryocaccobium stercorigallinarum]|nr:cytidylate kinase-like family protein [Candidatus Alectryocaccobium stercorigallinarum]